MLKFLYRKSQSFCKKYIISLNHCNVYWKFYRISCTSSPCLSALRPLLPSFPAYSINFCRAAAALFCGAPYPRPVGNNKAEGRGEQLSLLSLPESQKGSIPLGKDTTSRSSLRAVTGAKFQPWSPLPTTSTPKWHTPYLNYIFPLPPHSQKNKAFWSRRLTFILLSIFIHIQQVGRRLQTAWSNDLRSAARKGRTRATAARLFSNSVAPWKSSSPPCCFSPTHSLRKAHCTFIDSSFITAV